MSDKIIILPPEIVNKIAAGEVVERPASVVKELVENSLDAQASLIEVEIRDAGRSLVRVTDDGKGMSREDALLCLKPHATSKISSLRDLGAISTLGFRGEALSAIAGVSLMRIISKNETMDSAVELEIEAGVIKSAAETGYPKGTQVEVSNLFFNTPARKKFLKSQATEMSHIIRVMEQFALASPQVSFCLIHQGEELMNLLVTGGLLKRIEDILGKGLTGNLLEIKSEGKVFKIYGFIGKPALSRLDKKGQFFFVNGRAVANRSLAHAVFSAYEEFLPKERFPLAIVYIEIGPQLVDVNVHPAKREVRFQNERLIHDSLRQVIRDCFLSNSLIPRVELSSVSTEETGKIAEQPSAYPQQGSYSLFKETGSSFPAVLLRKTPFLQISNLYILTSDEEGILIVDQHAASERIIFDLLCKEKQNREIQRLLIPEVIDLGHEESYILKENLQELKSIGFELEEFGKNSFQIRSVPAAVYNKSPRQIILDLISEIVQGQETKTLKLAREKLIALIACHSAIREGDCLGDLELSRLLQDLKTSASAYTCPHGRPTMIRLSWAELKKKFKRT